MRTDTRRASAAQKITITRPPPALHRWEWPEGSNTAFTWSRSPPHFASRHQRRHGNDTDTDAPPWHGSEGMIDQSGRLWERLFDAVMDDYGNLVEVVR